MALFGIKKKGRSNTPTPPQEEGNYQPPSQSGVGPVDVVETSQTQPATQVRATASDGSDDSKKKSLLEDPEDGDDADGYKSQSNKPMKEKIMENLTVAWASVLGCFGLPKALKIALLAGVAVGAVLFFALTRGRAPMFPGHVNVAFVGNSYFYVNDLPRFVENIANGQIFQDSCLHNSASILEIVMTGNGMWNKWATKTAMIGGVKYETQAGNTEYLYDMGACSVPQLLTGHDKLVTSGDSLGSFINDGANPCFQQDSYLEYQESFDYKGGWDFVVVTDQAKRMCFDDTRHEALVAFNYTYGPILKKKRIAPIIVQPHAYQSSAANSTGLSDLPTFTALIMEGAVIYKKYLSKQMGWFSHATIAPVGNAFLAVREKDSSLYKKLFLDDGIHPSAYGTYLYGLVIYGTMLGYMPKYRNVVTNNIEEDLFGNARRLQASSSEAGFPDKEEAAILFKIAKKVALSGYKPKAIRGFKPEVEADEFIEEEVSDATYDGDYSVDVYSSYQQEYGQYYDNNGNYGNGNGYNDYYSDQNYGNNNGYQYGNNNNGYQYGGNYGNNNNNGYQNAYGGNYGNNNYNNGGNYNGQYGGN